MMKIAEDIVEELRLAGCALTSTAEGIVEAKLEPVGKALSYYDL